MIAVFFAATSIMTSCLDNDVDQITYTSETSITGFSLGTLHIDRVGKDQNGEDSAYVDTLDCSNYPFTIDQINRTITNKDSLPVGTHIDKVITSITYDAGMLAYKPKGSERDTIWTSTDSIDFTDPVEFKVYAYSGVEGKPYTQQYPIDSSNPMVSKEIDVSALWKKIVHNAWKSAEPGVLFWDTIIRESVPDCYADLGFRTVSTNPCGEIPLCPYDSCRLLAINLYSYVVNPFTPEA